MYPHICKAGRVWSLLLGVLLVILVVALPGDLLALDSSRERTQWLGSYVGAVIPGYEVLTSTIVVRVGMTRQSWDFDIQNESQIFKNQCLANGGVALVNVRMESHVGPFAKGSPSG
jgi:hypothetical protein